MFKQSVSSTLLAASLASKFLKDNGLLTLAGAAAALDATPGSLQRQAPIASIDSVLSGMIGYGAAKAATIHIGKSLAAPDSGMPKDSSVLTIAPYVLLLSRTPVTYPLSFRITLDTPMNRKWMPKADTGTWTPLEYIAE